jgi:hypothetical protein
MRMGMFLVFKSQIVHGVVLIKSTVFDTLNHLLRIHMVLLVDDLNHCIFNHNVLAFEVNEVCLGRLVSKAEFTCSQLPQFHTIFRINEDRIEEFLGSWSEE